MCLEITGSTAEVVTDEDRIRPAGSEVEVLLSDPTQREGPARLGGDGLARGRAAPYGRVAGPAGSMPRGPPCGTSR